MRLADSVHAQRPWRIHELTSDFRLEDVWRLPTPGGPGDFPRLVQAMAEGDPSRNSSSAVRTLFALRWKIGHALAWDDAPESAVEDPHPTLRDRLPQDLRDGPPGPAFEHLPFTAVYQTDDELAVEIFNRTVHGVLHLGWVPDGDGNGGHHGEMAVYVKPNGWLGRAYMAAIGPVRHRVVYPPLMREIGRDWRVRTAASREPA